MMGLMICIIHVCRVTRILVMLMERYSMHAKDAIIFSPNQVVTKIQVTLIRGVTVLFLDQVVVILSC